MCFWVCTHQPKSRDPCMIGRVSGLPLPVVFVNSSPLQVGHVYHYSLDWLCQEQFEAGFYVINPGYGVSRWPWGHPDNIFSRQATSALRWGWRPGQIPFFWPECNNNLSRALFLITGLFHIGCLISESYSESYSVLSWTSDTSSSNASLLSVSGPLSSSPVSWSKIWSRASHTV